MTTTTDLNLAYITMADESTTDIVWTKAAGERDLDELAEELRNDYAEDWARADADLKTFYVEGPYLYGWAEGQEEGEDDPAWVFEMADIRIDPIVPEGCSGTWVSPHELFGGLEENPGVRGNKGGEIIQEVCPQTGWKKTTDTWDQDCTGHGNPVESIEYEEPDSESLGWLNRTLAEEIAIMVDGTSGDKWAGEELTIQAKAKNGQVIASCAADCAYDWEYVLDACEWDIETYGSRKEALEAAERELLSQGAEGRLMDDLQEYLYDDLVWDLEGVLLMVREPGEQWKAGVAHGSDDAKNFYFDVETEQSPGGMRVNVVPRHDGWNKGLTLTFDPQQKSIEQIQEGIEEAVADWLRLRV